MKPHAAITVHRSRGEVERLWRDSPYRPLYIDGTDAAVTAKGARQATAARRSTSSLRGARRPAPSACARTTSWATIHGRGGRHGPGGLEPASRRSRRRPVPDRLRELLVVPARTSLGVRELQSQRRAGREDVRPPDRGIFGYSHLTGGQAEYTRVPYADVGSIKIEDDLPDKQVLCLSDIFPTDFFGAALCDIKGGDVVAVFGAGPVGQFAIASAVLLGAERVIAIDQYDYRLAMARNKAGVTDVIDFSKDADVVEQLKALTGGRGPDAVIDAVGIEAAHGHGALHALDSVKQATHSETERGHALRDAILACRPGGIVSVIGVYGGLLDKFPAGAFMNKACSCARASATSTSTWDRSASASETRRSTRASSAPIACRWTRRPTPMRPSSTSRTSA
jgi:threonine dehydrogenase-like Zn-dependent dehydrogenase